MKNILKLSAFFALCFIMGIGLAACGDDDNLDGVYEHSAEGTYDYTYGQLTLNITESDFTACGPKIGTLNFTVVSLTSTTMEWVDPDSDKTTWVRSSGTSGDIKGTWTMTQDGNEFEARFGRCYVTIYGNCH